MVERAIKEGPLWVQVTNPDYVDFRQNEVGPKRPSKGHSAMPSPVPFQAYVERTELSTTTHGANGIMLRGCELLIRPLTEVDLGQEWELVFLRRDRIWWEVYGTDYGRVAQLQDGLIRATCFDLLSQPMRVCMDTPFPAPSQFLL